jgi:multiple sugar transport system substrate-binding protein
LHRKLLFVFLCLLLAFSLAGCGNSETASQEEDHSNSGELKANLKIMWPGTSETEKEVAAKLKEKVESDYSGINIEFIFLSWSDMEQKMAVMVQSGDSPDLMMVQDITNPVAMDALEPLDGYLNDAINEEKFIPAAWENMQSGGTLYAVPGLAIIYSHVLNTQLFEAYGIDTPETWDDVISASHTLKENGKYGYAMANGGEGRFAFRDFMMVSLSNDLVPDQVDDSNKEKYLEVLHFFNDIAGDMPESQITWEYPELFKAWEAGDVGIMHTGNYFTANVIDHGNEAMDRTRPFAFPAGPSADKPQIMVGAVGMAMFKDSKHKEAAWKVIEALMSPDMLAQWGGSINTTAANFVETAMLEEVAESVYPDVYKQHVALSQKWSELAEQYGVPMPKILMQNQMEKVVQSALVRMLKREITPEEAYEEIRNGIEKIKEN